MFSARLGAIASARRGKTTLSVYRYPFLPSKAHLAVVTDETLPALIEQQTSLDRRDHSYLVAQVRKTPITKQDAVELYIVQKLFERGRIRKLEK